MSVVFEEGTKDMWVGGFGAIKGGSSRASHKRDGILVVFTLIDKECELESFKSYYGPYSASTEES